MKSMNVIMDDDLHAALVALAVRERRSLRSQIVYCLEQCAGFRGREQDREQEQEQEQEQE